MKYFFEENSNYFIWVEVTLTNRIIFQTSIKNIFFLYRTIMSKFSIKVYFFTAKKACKEKKEEEISKFFFSFVCVGKEAAF